MISKEEFCKYLEDLGKYDSMNEKIYDVMREFGGYVETPDLCYTLANDVVDLLAHRFDSENVEYIKNNIDYFCDTLEYGDNYKPGMVIDKDKNGKEIEVDFSSAEKLYEYIVRTYCKG